MKLLIFCCIFTIFLLNGMQPKDSFEEIQLEEMSICKKLSRDSMPSGEDSFLTKKNVAKKKNRCCADCWVFLNKFKKR